MKIFVAMGLALGVIFFHAICVASPEASKKADAKRLENRIDFGNAYILGQSIKSGAVYLMQRKQTEIQSMLKVRQDYRKEILEDFPTMDSGVTESPDTDTRK